MGSGGGGVKKKAKGGSPLANAALGSLASMICLTFLFPLNVAKTRMQAQTKRTASSRGGDDDKTEEDRRPGEVAEEKVSSKPYRGALDTILRVAKEEGPSRLYVGLRPALVGQGIRNFIFFFAWTALDPVFARINKKLGKAAAVFTKILQGIVAGTAVQLVCLPIGMVTARMVNKRGAAAETKQKQASVLSTVSKIYAEGGIIRFWEGLGAGLSLTLNPGITMSVNGQITEALVAMKGEGESSGLSAGQDFAVGALSKCVASTVTYPMVTVKVRLQTAEKVGDGDNAKATTAAMLLYIIQSEGVSGLYNGLGTHLLYSVLKEASLNMVRQQLRQAVGFV